MKKALYIHIPFCKKKCFYCDFYSVRCSKDIISSYIEVLCNQISKVNQPISTIFIGGGTPTVLDMAHLERLLVVLRKVSKGVEEFTIEANPESLDKERIDLFLKEGCNRISIGVQSFREDKLEKLGRIHSVEQAKRAVFLARERGFKNISIDLIFGVWGQSLDNWKKELKEAVKLPIKHISVYSLTPERRTPFFKAIEKGHIKTIDEEVSAAMYMFALRYLPKKGFLQYEVSNFSKRGYKCKHNLSYWQNEEYIGLGPSAVSYIKGIRQRNSSNLKSYINKIKKGESSVVFREKLPPLKQAKERAAINIRMKQGIDFKDFKKRSGFDFLKLEKEAVDKLTKDNLLKYKRRKDKKTGVYLTDKGFLFCDIVSSCFI
jgi:oxygen-independent coproporphyrinogen-3 oxidase